MFLERKNNQPIHFIDNLSFEISNGDLIELRVNEEKIYANVIDAINRPNEYRGVICELSHEYDSLAIDQEVTFNEKQIFACFSEKKENN